MTTPAPWRHSAALMPLHGRQPTTVLRPTTYASLFTRTLPLVISTSRLATISGLRPLSCVIPTACDCIFIDRFPYFGVPLAALTAWLHFAGLQWGICFPHWSGVVSHHARASGRQNDVRGPGRHRVSSSCGAKLHFGAVVVFVCFICGCIFKAPFSSFEWVVFFVCCKKHVLPLACIFSTDF